MISEVGTWVCCNVNATEFGKSFSKIKNHFPEFSYLEITVILFSRLITLKNVSSETNLDTKIFL